MEKQLRLQAKGKCWKVNNHGFTLIEMLIVLTVVAVISAVAIPSVQGVVAERQLRYFLEQFTNDMLYAQQYAMTRKKTVSVVFDYGECRYRITEGGTAGKELVYRFFPSPFQLQPTTLQSPLSFFANGNVNKAGTILVTYGKKIYKIVFLLGKGRFYAQKV